MLIAVISLLIYACVLALIIYLVIWVLQSLVGVTLPGKVIQILWIIFVLIVLLMLVRIVLAGGGLSLGLG